MGSSGVLFNLTGRPGASARANSQGLISRNMTPTTKEGSELARSTFRSAFFGDPEPPPAPKPPPERKIGKNAWPTRFGLPLTDPQCPNGVDGLPVKAGRVAEYRLGGSSTSV